MELKVESRTTEFVRITVPDIASVLVRDRIRGFFPNHRPEAQYSILVAFHEFVAQRPVLLAYCEANEISVEEDIYVTTRITRFDDTKRAGREFTKDTLELRLAEAGFSRELKPFQMRNVLKMCTAMQGASFSVPGAGKTTEALAYYFALREDGDTLLVIAPKNAFCAWEEQLAECVKGGSRTFVRLTGGEVNARKLLRERHAFYLLNYQSLGRWQKTVGDYLADNPRAFVFLDESHRAKNPHGVTADAIRKLAVLPKGKLLLSGTPMPQSPRDLIPQVSFLFPDEDIREDNVVERIQSVYVRTTAPELGIPDIHHEYHDIKLDSIEMKAYSRMRALSTKALADPNPKDARYLRSLGRSVMRLLGFVANPATLATELAQFDPRLQVYLSSRDGKKIAYVCQRARELASQGKKVLIWSSFIRNVELLATRLADLGADYIHGGVQAGSEEEEGTRERKIARFHNDDQAMVLVANPAAASEGISLHKVCQHAIYLDRSFNAAHFLQSQDRIHRIGMPQGTFPTVDIVRCRGTIDEVVDLRLNAKIDAMAQMLGDPSIHVDGGVFEEDDETEVESAGLSPEDCESILEHLNSI